MRTVALLGVGPYAEKSKVGDADPTGRRLVLTPASSIVPEPLRWAWRGRIPDRGLTLIAGEPGLGKSTTTVELTAAVTRGTLDGDHHGQPRDVLFATAEDHFASVVWGRLTAADADMDRVHRVAIEDRDGEALLTLPDDITQLELECQRLAAEGRPVGLLTVDPIGAFLSAGLDSHRDASVRRVLAPLAGLAERQHLAVLAVAHLNKDTAGKLLARVGGSVAFGAAPRSVLAFARHPEDPEGEQGSERVIVHAKSNHGAFAPTLAARIVGTTVEEVGDVSRLVLEGECEISASDLSAQPEGDHHDRDAAAEWLADELADGDWHESRDIKAGGDRAGHSVRTLQRAKQALRIEDRRVGFPPLSEWRLPSAPTGAGADGATDAGANSSARIPEAKPDLAHGNRATSSGGGVNGHEGPPADALADRILAEFPGSYEVAA